LKIFGKATVFKDEKGTCRISISNNELQEDGKEKERFMRIIVGFKKGVEIKNMTKINVTDGFITFFRISTGETTVSGEPIYKKFPKLMIMDFEILEEGTDEVFKKDNYNEDKDNVFENYYSESSFNSNDLPF